MILPSKDDIQYYLDKKHFLLYKKARYIGTHPSIEMSLCRGIIIPFLFKEFHIVKAPYFIQELFDLLTEYLYCSNQSLIDYNYYCRLSLKFKNIEYLNKTAYKRYEVIGIKTKPFKIPKSKYGTNIQDY